MSRLVKYLFLLLVGVVLMGNARGAETDVVESLSDWCLTADYDIQSSISASESEFCLPRTASYANTQRVQSGARRTNTIQRNNLEFAKAGKVMNAGIRYLVQNQSVIVHSTLIEPSHRLLSLGRLII